MTRDHYKGSKKTRDAQVDSDGRLLPLEKGGGSPAITMFNQSNSNTEIVTYRADGLTVNVYVDIVNGDDDNDGLSASRPIKTLLAVQRKFPLHMINESRTIVNLMNSTSSQVTYTVGALHLGGGDEILLNSYVYRGPEMLLITPATGLPTAALDSTPAVIADQAGGDDGSGKRTRLDFTTASPGWTVDDLQGHFVRVTRAGVRVFDELPITKNSADTLFVDCLGIVGVILATDTVEIVEPAVIIAGKASSFSVTGARGAGGVLGNTLADEMGSVFERISFQDMMTAGVYGLQFDRCRFGDGGGFSILMLGGTANFRNTVSTDSSIQIHCGSTTHPAGRSDDASLNPSIQVGLNVVRGSLLIGGSSATNPRYPALFVSSFPVAVYDSPVNGIIVYGNGTAFMMDSATSLTGDGNAAAGIHCKQGAYVRVNGGNLTSITGTSGALRLTSGAVIGYGTGVGDFQEAAGFNGNFTRALEGTAAAPTGDSSIITTASIS